MAAMTSIEPLCLGRTGGVSAAKANSVIRNDSARLLPNGNTLFHAGYGQLLPSQLARPRARM